jgi:hypothetical protein
VRALTVSEIIQLWETAYQYHPVDRALCMLQPVLPDQGRDELAALTIGQRDALLLALRLATFGDVLTGVSHCPVCASTVEFELSCRALRSGVTTPHTEQLSEGGYKLMIRPLNSFDLAEAAMAETEEESRAVLLQRCVSEALYQDQTVTIEALPGEIEERIAESALAADAQAEMLLDMNCPECRHRWQSVLDIAHVLWLEISARAQRLLFEVHVLAKAYGWRETEIFELSPQRRAAYLQMATA